MYVCVYLSIYIYIPTNNHMLNQCVYIALYGSERTKLWNIQTFLMKLIEKKALQVFIVSPSEKKKKTDRFRWQIPTVFWEIHFSFIEICQVGNGWLTKMRVLVLAPKIKAGSITQWFQHCSHTVHIAMGLRFHDLMGNWSPYLAKARVVTGKPGRIPVLLNLHSHTLAIKKYTLA